MNTSLLQFELQQSLQLKLMDEIRSGTYVGLVKSYNEPTQEYERQAIIVAGQELGYFELAIQFIQQSDLNQLHVCQLNTLPIHLFKVHLSPYSGLLGLFYLHTPTLSKHPCLTFPTTATHFIIRPGIDDANKVNN
jgi:hypothetical protein